jgi:glycosyltransferase involved in cell wall biosynthesis
MEEGSKKLRIVLICHFMNKTIQQLLGMDGNEKELAPWIGLEIEEIKKRDDIELHLISPFVNIIKSQSFIDGNVNYHCIKIGVPFMRRYWPSSLPLNEWTNFFVFNFQVRRLINSIKPDLINLSGAENAYYSSSILGIKGYPVIVTIQGFVSLNNTGVVTDPVIKNRIRVEAKIMSELKYFGIEASFMESYIRKYNKEAKMFWYHFLFAKTAVLESVPKEFDVVFFARITKMKGIEDLIKAVSIARDRKPDIKLCIIGHTYGNELTELKNLISSLNLDENIVFKGFIPTQREMHMEVVKSRISVLPTYNDTIPGTIVESMLLGLPMISYETGGIPDLNKDGENLILVEQGNVAKLADAIVDLLGDTKKQEEIAVRARNYALFEFDNTRSVDLKIKAFREVIQDYHNEA